MTTTRLKLSRRIVCLLAATWTLLAAPACVTKQAPEAKPAAQPMSIPLSLIPVYPEDTQIGPASALVTVVTFADFSTAAGRESYLKLRAWSKSAAAKETRLIVKFSPAEELGEQIAASAIAVQRARGSEACLAFLDRVAQSKATLDPSELTELAFTRDPSGANAGAQSATALSILEQMQRDRALYTELGVAMPWQLFVNGTPVAQPEAQALSTVLGKERLAARALQAQYANPAAVYALRVQDNWSAAKQELDITSPLTEHAPVPSWGSTTAAVSIVAFIDYQCPFSQRVMKTLERVRSNYGPARVRIAFHHNPLPFHKQARAAHDAAAAVFALGGNAAFLKFQDRLFENQKNLNPERFAEWAEAAGISRAKFTAAATRYDEVVEADLALGKRIGVNGTPAFRINGATLSGAQPFEAFQSVIDQQLQEAAQLSKQGVPAAKVAALLTKQHLAIVTPEPVHESEPPAPDLTVWKVPVEAADPVLGRPDALVTIVEYGDFQCPFTQRVQATLDEVVRRYDSTVRIVWKDNPLPFHERAIAAATAARTAFVNKGNDAFWGASKNIFNKQPELDDQALIDAVTETGVAAETVRAALRNLPYANQFALSSEYAADIGATGTPSFFINGRKLVGAQPYEEFAKLIDEQLAEARRLVGNGTTQAELYETLMKTAQGPKLPDEKAVDAPLGSAPFRGPKDATLVVQMFSDFQCPFCNRVNPTLDELLVKNPKVKLVWRNMPLPFHGNAQLAAEAAHEVFTQKGNAAFWKYHDALFENQKGLGRETLDKLARKQGVNMKRFKAALDNHTHLARVTADADAANKAGIAGTPAFVVGKYFLSGAQPLRAFQKLIELQTHE